MGRAIDPRALHGAEDATALAAYRDTLRRCAPLAPDDLLALARGLGAERAAFVAAALRRPATVDALLARWRRQRSRGLSTAVLSAHHAERNAGDPSTQVDAGLARVERLAAQRASRAATLDRRLARAVEQAELAFEVIVAAFREGLENGDARPAVDAAIEEALASLAAYHALRARLVEHNLRLVVAFARIYRGMGVPLADLVQEGNLGLMRAVERFDPERGSRFSTYAAWWIHQSMIRAIQRQSRTVRVPSHVFDLQRRYRRVEDALRATRGGEPERSVVAERLGLARAPLDALTASMAPIVSTTRADDAPALEDTLAAEPGEWPAAALDRVRLDDAIRAALPALSPRERFVIELRFGLAGAPEATLQDVGRRLGLSRERVRQIEVRALARLRRRPSLLGVASLLDAPRAVRPAS